MTFRTLIRRSLRFHWRAHLGVVLGAAIGSAALIGALVVGDSVRESLRERAFERLGNVYHALAAGDRFFRAQLAAEILGWREPDSVSSTVGAPVLLLPGTATTKDGDARANRVQVLGVDDRFWKLANSASFFVNVPDDAVFINEALAQQLRAKVGDVLVLRVSKPDKLSREATLAPTRDESIALRLSVGGVVADSQLGRFSLQVGRLTPLNAFINLKQFEDALHLTNQANVLLIARDPRNDSKPLRISSNILKNAVDLSLRTHLQLADGQLKLQSLHNPDLIELRTERVFLDGNASRSALATDTTARPILTYLVNLLRAGTNTTPYSMVTAAGAPWTPTDMRDDEIVLSKWLAEDLRVKPGDEMSLVYFDPESGARLVERTNAFRVRAIVPMDMPWADRTLMPDFPGIEKAESTSDWDAGFPLVHKIRDKDEDYWKQHRGTPKAFITLAAGQKMWANRFGGLTAIRFPIPTNWPALTPSPRTPKRDGADARTHPDPLPQEREIRSSATIEAKAGDNSAAPGKPQNDPSLSPLPRGEGQGEGNQAESFRAALEEKILANLKPEELGLRFEPVREQALKAAEQSQDFGGLFLGFSFFLIIAALLLMAMLFQFGLEQRTAEIGTLLALGFTPQQVRRLLLGEGVALALIGGVLGALGGLVYARAMLHGLATIWRDAVGASTLSFHATTQTLVIGLFAATVVGAITIWLALRKFVRRSARELLVGEVGMEESKVRRPKSKVIAVGALVAAVTLAGWTVATGDTANAGAFFGAGALVLIAGLSFVSAWLARSAGSPLTHALSTNRPLTLPSPPMGERLPHGEAEAPAASFTLGGLAVGGCARRRTRSLATIAMLACGSFLIVSIGVFRLDANRDASERSSGTGGFAMIGETTMPVVHDLNSQSGRDFFALSERDLEGVSFVPFRVRTGDEASCLNLNRAQKPRLLGVNPELLSERQAFSFANVMKDTYTKVHPWSLLSKTSVPDRAPVERDEIPAIGDANSIQWAMHKKVGDTIDYVDERGQPFKVRIVGAVANSILQGQLIIDEAEFVRRFPGESGYRMFLIDAPSNRGDEVSATLSRAMQDVGLELTPAAQRLAQFNAVQNTYLGTFQVLGGLGLLLGSVGLGIVVLRNVLERRGELAVLLAVGFRKPTLQRLLLIENGTLLALGLALGIVAAAVAVLPALLSPVAQLPYVSLALTLGAVLINGALWTWAATRFALRGNLLAALRNE